MTDLDVLPEIIPDDGVVIARLADVTARQQNAARVDVAGVRGAADAVVLATLARASGPVLAVTSDLDAALRLAQDTRFFMGQRARESDEDMADADDVLVLATSDSSPYADVNPDRRAAMNRMATLAHLAADRPYRVLVVAATALARKVVPPEVVRAHTHQVVVAADLDRDALTRSLVEGGYIRVPIVEDPGSFAVRGSLLDVWPPGVARPARIELDGDFVLSIKPFDANTQTTVAESLAELWLPPARETLLSAECVARARAHVLQLADAVDWPTTKTRVLTEDVMTGRAFFGADGYLPAYYETLTSLGTYLPPSMTCVLASPSETMRAIEAEVLRTREDAQAKLGEPHFPPEAFIEDEAQIEKELAKHHVVTFSRAPVTGEGAGLGVYEVTRDPIHLAALEHDDLTRAVKSARSSKQRASTLAPVARRVKHWRSNGLRVFLTARARTQAERLQGLLQHLGVRCRVRTDAFDPSWLTEPHRSDEEDAQIVVGPLGRGVVMPGEGFAIVTEEEVFGGRAHRARERKVKDAARPFLEDLRSLAVGDYVVHVEHGIGRYAGLVHKNVGSLTVDLLVVEYAVGDKLYLPVYRLNQIQKYSGGEAGEPKIDRLGGATFSKTKARVRKAVRQMADDLLRLYAERKAEVGEALEPADDDYRAFEATFTFDETDDQARAIDDVNRDLETPRPMDRLVCGDVGFGKTEVAIRAAFRVAISGKQVAVLCPTTVLAQQHLRTFEARMQDYPITVRVLSRFQTSKEQDEILRGVKEGKVEILIGTHRLLSKDVHFESLGLLVVDEEQRFGVTHKERIKVMRTKVDVLTLSATPIPRTLQMAVTGLRDLSLITTPPIDRRAVRTFVTRMDDQVLREAIGRELSRGGQVFYVYNRVEGLYEKAQRIQELFPSARIAVAHGQMSGKGKRESGEGALEKTMLDFVEGRFDILVATAIVESGLDIPRANTIVIDRADLFGLAQLYQLRGRVGRAKERAYCYLIVPPANAITDEARARIDALERHTDLGSGFKIASLDLELRGAGDLLGAEQSGNVASVGLDLFCQMLDEAVHELRGEPVEHEVDPDLSFDVSAFLPDDYVSDVGLRLSLYKRLACAIDENHVGELATEMEDRFGAPPAEAACLVRLMTVKCGLRRLRVLGCEATSKLVTLHLREDTPLDSAKVLELVRAPKSAYKLTPDMRLSRRFDGTENGLSNCEAMVADLGKAYKDDA